MKDRGRPRSHSNPDLLGLSHSPPNPHESCNFQERFGRNRSYQECGAIAMTGPALESFFRRRGIDPERRLSRTGKMMYLAPSSIVLSGVYFQGEVRRKRLLIVHPFLNVISVPRGYRSLGYGSRIRTRSNRESFDLDCPPQDTELVELLNNDLLPMIEENSSPEGAIRHILAPRLLSGGLHRYEDLAHLYLWTGQIDASLECLQNAIWEAELGGHRVQWVTELGHRCLRLYRRIHWDRAAALEQLKDWAWENAASWRVQLAPESMILPRG